MKNTFLKYSDLELSVSPTNTFLDDGSEIIQTKLVGYGEKLIIGSVTKNMVEFNVLRNILTQLEKDVETKIRQQYEELLKGGKNEQPKES